MPLEEHLASGEIVVASCDDLYATDRRLIRYGAPKGREEIDSLEYPRITSVQVVVQRKLFLTIMGFVVLLLGLLDPGRAGPVLSLVMVAAGIAALVYGIMSRRVFLEFRVRGMDRISQAEWRLPNPHRNAARGLERAVRLRILSGQSPQEPAQNQG